jgi:predicted metal-dependent peptidase
VIRGGSEGPRNRHSDPESALSRAITALVLEEPFFGHLLGGLVRSVDPRIDTAGVWAAEGRIGLSVHPEFFCGLASDDERVAVIKHEALHLVFGHLFRRSPEQDPLLYNIAADLVVNQYVGERWPLPRCAVTLQSFPELELEPLCALGRYYDALAAAAHDLRIRGRLAAFGVRRGSDHGGWARDTLGEAALGRALRSAWDRIGPRGHGTLPGPLAEAVEAQIATHPPRIGWRTVLRMFSASSGRSRITHTTRRPSRRYGTVPGLRIRRAPRLVVAVDTSGSISDRELSDFFSEVTGIWRQGAVVQVVECDALVQRSWPFDGTPPACVGGRGGTAFDPVFAWACAQQERWDGIVYLTDGWGPTPTIQPPCPVLWVICAGGTLAHTAFGQAVQLT